MNVSLVRALVSVRSKLFSSTVVAIADMPAGSVHTKLARSGSVTMPASPVTRTQKWRWRTVPDTGCSPSTRNIADGPRDPILSARCRRRWPKPTFVLGVASRSRGTPA